MSIDARPRADDGCGYGERGYGERGYADRDGRGYADRSAGVRGYREHSFGDGLPGPTNAATVGANALRIGLFDDDDLDDFDSGGGARSRGVRATGSATSRRTTGPSRTTGAARPTTPARATPPRTTAMPRPRRGRTPWVSDVTPTAPHAHRAPEPLPLPVSLPKTPFLLLILSLVVVGVVGVLVLNTKINENSFRLGDLRDTRSDLTVQEQALQRELADLESPGNLLDAATDLGLVPAGTPAYINLPDGRVVGVPQPAFGGPTASPAGDDAATPGR